MISIDQVLLGLIIIAFLASIPLGIAGIGMLLFGTRPASKGRRTV